VSASVRSYLEAELKPLLPTTWRIIPNQRIPETIDRVTVALKVDRIEKLPEAPLGNLRNTVILTVADPHKDQVRAENALDDAVLNVLTALDGHSNIDWTLAQKVLATETYLGWDITLTVITSKES